MWNDCCTAYSPSSSLKPPLIKALVLLQRRSQCKAGVFSIYLTDRTTESSGLSLHDGLQDRTAAFIDVFDRWTLSLVFDLK